MILVKAIDQKEEEDGLAPCTFPAPCTHNFSQESHIPFLNGAIAEQSTNQGLELVD